MPDEPHQDTAATHPKDLDLRTRKTTGPISADAKRFHIFLIDTGWNTPVSKLVRTHLPTFYEFNTQDSLYLLTPQQSIEILKRAPEFIGHDPTILVYDLYAPSESKRCRYRGFRLNLGRFKNAEQALSRLQEFVRFVLSHRTAASLDREVKRSLHREGAKGMIKILREASTELL